MQPRGLSVIRPQATSRVVGTTRLPSILPLCHSTPSTTMGPAASFLSSSPTPLNRGQDVPCPLLPKHPALASVSRISSELSLGVRGLNSRLEFLLGLKRLADWFN